MHLRHKIVKL